MTNTVGQAGSSPSIPEFLSIENAMRTRFSFGSLVSTSPTDAFKRRGREVLPRGFAGKHRNHGDQAMFSIIKTALATSIVLGSASRALAQGGFDPNPANRYPAYAEPGTYGYSPNANVPVRMQPTPHATFQS